MWTSQCTPAHGLLENPKRHEPSSPPLSAKRIPVNEILKSPSRLEPSCLPSIGHHQGSCATTPGPVLNYDAGVCGITNGVSSHTICLVPDENAVSPQVRHAARISLCNEGTGSFSIYADDGANRELGESKEVGVAVEKNKGNRKSRGGMGLQWKDCPVSPFSPPSRTETTTTPSAADIELHSASDSLASEPFDTTSMGALNSVSCGGSQRGAGRGNEGTPSTHTLITTPRTGKSDHLCSASATNLSTSREFTTKTETISQPRRGAFGGWRVVGSRKSRRFRGSKGGNKMTRVMPPATSRVWTVSQGE